MRPWKYPYNLSPTFEQLNHEKFFPYLSRVNSSMNPQRILIFTVHKAASMFLYNLCKELTQHIDMPYYSVNHCRKNALYFNSEDGDIINRQWWKNKHGCFAPLRLFLPLPTSGKLSLILHLRDHRDVLTSFYFSCCYSHPKVEGIFSPADQLRQEWIDMGIDRFIFLKQEENTTSWAEIFLNRYNDYCRQILPHPDVIFVKYEELVTDFRSWLTKVIQPFQIVGKNELVDTLVEKHANDFSVKQENVYQHKRKITPGDFREKFTPGTIDRLNDMFADILQQLQYEI